MTVYMKSGIVGKLAKFLQYLDSLPVMLPANGKGYIGADKSYHIGGGRLVRITEKQANLATIMATDSSITSLEATVKAGYSLQDRTIDAITNKTPVSKLQANFSTRYAQAMTNSAVAYMNMIKKNNMEALSIDKDWVLGQQVALFEEVKREKNYTAAVRLLHDIAQHTDIDALASNKIVVEQSVDYAAILSQADNRAIRDVSPISIEE